MKLKIPKTIHGIDGEKAYQAIMNKKQSPDKTKKETQKFKGNFIKSDYIQIPNQDFVIAIAETDKNLTYEQAHKKIIKKDLLIPTANQFIIFHNHFHNCHKNNTQIFDANANPISENTKNDLYNQLTKDCWTWLNGKFNISNKKKTIEYIIGLDSKDNLLTKTEPLENYLIEACYIDFTKLTKQGLGLIKHSNQNFEPGKNIYFWKPVEGSVARFDANEGRASLNCGRIPFYAFSDLGVRAVRHE